MRRQPLLAYVTGALFLLVVFKLFFTALFLKSEPGPATGIPSALAEDKAGVAKGDKAPTEDLRKREMELRAREDRVKKREAELLPLKEEIEARMAELTELQSVLTAHAKELAEREKALSDTKMDHLVTLYSAMDPSKAAAILDKLKLDTVVLILKHMKGKSAGGILAMMDAEKGARISEELSRAQ